MFVFSFFSYFLPPMIQMIFYDPSSSGGHINISCIGNVYLMYVVPLELPCPRGLTILMANPTPPKKKLCKPKIWDNPSFFSMFSFKFVKRVKVTITSQEFIIVMLFS